MQKHGAKRSPGGASFPCNRLARDANDFLSTEFKELRKQWRLQKKEADEAERERERQERLGMVQPFGMLHAVSLSPHAVALNSQGGIGMAFHGHYQYPMRQGSDYPLRSGDYPLRSGDFSGRPPSGEYFPPQRAEYAGQQQQREMHGREYGLVYDSYAAAQGQPGTSGDFDQFLLPTSQPPPHPSQQPHAPHQRRQSLGYPLSPASMYSSGTGTDTARNSISSVTSAGTVAGAGAGEELEYPNEEYDMEYNNAYSQSQGQAQSQGQGQGQGQSQQQWSGSNAVSGANERFPATWDVAPSDPHPHTDEPLLASHVALGSNRLPPDSTLLTPYVPAPAQREQGQGDA